MTGEVLVHRRRLLDLLIRRSLAQASDRDGLRRGAARHASCLLAHVDRQ
jgi:hypothetical protein